MSVAWKRSRAAVTQLRANGFFAGMNALTRLKALSRFLVADYDRIYADVLRVHCRTRCDADLAGLLETYHDSLNATRHDTKDSA